MSPLFLILALVLQCSIIHAEKDAPDATEDITENPENRDDEDTSKMDDFLLPMTPIDPNWFEMFVLPNNNLFSSPAAAVMAQITNSNKTQEEQLQDMKEMCQQLSKTIEEELMKLFIYAIENTEKGTNATKIRTRRSVETPMDSTEMVMRLLRHIKSSNEYQNIAIDKMMTAQEIAQKFGIEYNPDPEILSELALAANDHAKEITNLLKDACDLKNVTTERVDFIPVVDEPKKENETYYMYGVHPTTEKTEPSFEYIPDVISRASQPSINHVHSDPFIYYNYPYETQVSSPPVYSAPATPKPSLYDPFMYPFSPATDINSPYCSVDSMMPVLIPVEELEPEPELVGEEVEETITSKMIVEKGDDPGATTVNHVTTYTISERSHFRPPQTQNLPQHFQYCFFLV